MHRRSLSILVALLLILGAGAAFAQGLTNATLRGRVTNEGQGLPGVTVTITSRALQGARTAATSTNGDYVFPALPPGEYTVAFALQGFKTETRTLPVTVGQEARLDAALSLTGVEAAATVVAKSETVSTSTPQAAQTFTKELTDALPVTRSLLSSVALSAGVNTNGPGSSDRLGNGVAPVVTISGGQSFDNLFTVDGAVVTDNVRGTPNNLFIEDAIAETTTSTSTVSAEFGRFTGGIVNTVTKSGGNNFSGSFRTTFTNAAWSATTPANEATPQKLNPQYEATLGGPIWKDHVWFFGSGRYFDQTSSGQTTFTNISYPVGDTEKRYQGKLTLTPVVNHTISGNYLHVDEEQKNSSFCPTGCLDLDSLVPARQLPQDILTVNYNGVLSNSFFVEGLYSRRKFTFENSGSPYTDLIKGTIIRDRSRSNARYNSPTFCGVCDPESRDNRDYLVKGTWFLSTGALGSHNIVFGYDNFSGQRKSNNYQSGSNYRLFVTNTLITNNDLFPVVDSHSYVYYTPIFNLSKGTDALTHSVFVNDSWRLNDRLSVNLGVRWDKNHAKDSNGVVRADDSTFSPRVAAAWDVTGKGTVRVGASYAKYVGAIQDSLVDSSSDGGSPALFIWYYEGAPINVNPAPGAPLVTRAQALQQVFDWFFSQGCPNLATCTLPLAYASIPGLSTKFLSSLDSPSTIEYAATVAGNLGASVAYRVDVVRREGRDFYNNVINGSTGTGSDEFGNHFDIGIINNSNSVKRNYTGLHTSLSYRKGGFNGGVNWTWSHTLGNLVGETAASGPVPNVTETYPEYKDPAWNNPYGSLSTDERHRVKLFASYTLPFVPAKLGSLNVSAIQSIDTGIPYGAVGLVDSASYVTGAPSYATPPSSVNYYFTARDAFRTDTIYRTDLALNFSTRIAGTFEIFVQPQVLNVLNRRGLRGVSTSVRTAVNSAAFQPFNPFTETPVQGVNWNYASTFGHARNNLDYQLPRTFTIAAGLRF
jgi:hypothetical protein